jgi:predicted permease
MTWFSDLSARIGSLLGRRRADRELGEELSFHVDMEAEQLQRAGLSAGEARRQAAISLGGRSQVAEDTRDARGIRWMEDLIRDTKHAARQLQRSPAFTLAAVLTLMLGIGATTAIFSVIDGVLLRPVPLHEADRLVVVWETDRSSGTEHEPSAWPDYVDFKAQSRSLAAVAALRGRVGNLTPLDGEPSRVAGVAVTHDFFGLLGVDPLLGRTFLPEEDVPGGPRVVILGEAFWRSRYAGDPAILGQSIRLNESDYQVIGVMAAAADFGLDQLHARADYHADYLGEGAVDLWVPNAASEAASPRSTHPFLVFGRLAPGASVASASEELGQIAAELEETYPQSNTARGARVESLDTVVFGPVRPVLMLLAVAVALVLVVACVNVANLQLARGTTRAHEVAVRGALGAGAARLGRQFLVESLLLSLVGGAAGVGFAYLGLQGLSAMIPAELPRVASIGLDLRVLTVAVVASIVVGVAFGLVPMLQARRVDPINVIRSAGPGSGAHRAGTRLRSTLVVGELALSVALVTSAGLLVRSLWTVLSVDPGFEVEGIVKAEYQLPASRYPLDFSRYPNLDEIHGFNARLLDRARAIPGVDHVALAGAHPLDRGFTNSFLIVGREEEAQNWPEISMRLVSPGYFATMGVPSLAGRLLADGDDANAPLVALINASARALFFPDGSEPIGQHIRFWGRDRMIVGVVGDERVHGLTEVVPPATYVTTAQAPVQGGVLLVRARGNLEPVLTAVRRAITDVDPQLAVYGVEPMAETLRTSVAGRRFAATLTGLFALMTVLLALVGIHGVIAYATAQRSQEIGVRMALGATGAEVSAMVIRGGLRLAVVGIALGLAGAWAGSKLLGQLLFGVGSLDLVTFSVVPVVVILATMLACWLPARRAARAEPVSALRATGEA